MTRPSLAIRGQLERNWNTHEVADFGQLRLGSPSKERIYFARIAVGTPRSVVTGGLRT